jgi:hypothetical protein
MLHTITLHVALRPGGLARPTHGRCARPVRKHRCGTIEHSNHVRCTFQPSRVCAGSQG